MENLSAWTYLVGAVLGSGVLGALISWRVSLRVSARQAEATVEAARVTAESSILAAKQDAEALIRTAQQNADATYGAAMHHAIRGEQLRLRASVMERRLAAFNEALSDLLSSLSDLCSARELGERLPGILERVSHNAVLASGPHEESSVREVVRPFVAWGQRLAQTARQATDIDQVRSERAYRLVLEGIEGVARVVDWAAEKRIEQAAYLRVPGADILPPQD
jgi:hypothetical protein